MAEAALQLTGLTKRFGATAAVDGVHLTVAPGEFVTLLGPSGCGKTTTLNLVAGFLTPDGGEIRLAGKSVGDLPPFKRDLGLVFQDYALFPHDDRRGECRLRPQDARAERGGDQEAR